MPATTALHLGLATALALETWLLHGTTRAVAWALTALAFVGLVTALVVHPRTQIFVPTRWRAPAGARGVAFTFDDGPDPTWTPRVLDVLARHGAKGTFFVLGRRALAHPELVRRIRDEGHALGCHSHDHALSFHFSTARAQASDLQRAEEALRQLGTETRWFRPPQGIRTPQQAKALPSHLACVTWTARGLDSLATTAESILARLEGAVRDGAILTLHDGTGLGGGHDRAATVAALDVLLARARERGLRCVSLDTWLEEVHS
jgi:peptidoglycan-N-acetylglucosamine deacetylase